MRGQPSLGWQEGRRGAVCPLVCVFSETGRWCLFALPYERTSLRGAAVGTGDAWSPGTGQRRPSVRMRTARLVKSARELSGQEPRRACFIDARWFTLPRRDLRAP